MKSVARLLLGFQPDVFSCLGHVVVAQWRGGREHKSVLAHLAIPSKTSVHAPRTNELRRRR
jgi:hypothetical protein